MSEIEPMMNLPKKPLIAIAILAIGVLVLYGVVETFVIPIAQEYTNIELRSFGTTTLAIGGSVYWDITTTFPCTYIDWGEMSPGESESVTLYVRNEGSVPFTANMTTGNYTPTYLEQYITSNWTFGDFPLGTNRVRKVELFVYISPDIVDITDFEYWTYIQMYEVVY